jgi:hypothetical protein
MTRHAAIANFIQDKALIYSNNYESNIDHIVDKLHPVQQILESTINEHSVAFFFNDSSGECLHGARYLEKFHHQDVGNRWTSKLGSSITISHELDDLLYGAYGDALYYAAIN